MPQVIALLLSLLLCSSTRALAQEPPAPPIKRASALRVMGDAIHVDRRLDEPEWEGAPVLADFTQKEPVEGDAPTERMEIRFAYDATALYIGARMYKTPGSPIQAPMGRRDRFEQAENVQIALDTFHDRRTAYVFGVTAAGVRIDRFHAEDNETTFDEGFNPVWQARTSVDPQVGSRSSGFRSRSCGSRAPPIKCGA